MRNISSSKVTAATNLFTQNHTSNVTNDVFHAWFGIQGQVIGIVIKEFQQSLLDCLLQIPPSAGQGFSLFSCRPNSVTRAKAWMVVGICCTVF